MGSEGTDSGAFKERAARLRRFHERGLLIRGAFSLDDADIDSDDFGDDAHRVCWLAALSPEVEAEEQSEACPTSFLPRQFAQLIPWLDDAGYEDDDDPASWKDRTARFVALMERAHVLGEDGWEHFDQQLFRAFKMLFGEVLVHPVFDEERALLASVKLGDVAFLEPYVESAGIPPTLTWLIHATSRRQWADVAGNFAISYHAYVGEHRHDVWWDQQDIEERIITDVFDVFEQVIATAEGRLACSTLS